MKHFKVMAQAIRVWEPLVGYNTDKRNRHSLVRRYIVNVKMYLDSD
jgi:hypothetical protein